MSTGDVGAAPTRAEWLFIARRRANKSQIEAARVHGVGLSLYRRWEQGVEEPPTGHRAFGAMNPRPHERAVLARRRVGLTQRQLAHRLKFCRFWVGRMEAGEADPSPLLKHFKLQ